MRTIKLTIAYDGADFAGWQFQTNQRTVQDTLEQTLAKITGQFSRVIASGRTDAGVHALAQIVSFDTDSTLPNEVLWRALNAELPYDVSVPELKTHRWNSMPSAKPFVSAIATSFARDACAMSSVVGTPGRFSITRSARHAPRRGNSDRHA